MSFSKTLGLSQTEIADRVGVPPSQINRYMNGHSDVYSAVLVKILHELGLNLESMVDKRINQLSKMDLHEDSTKEDMLLFLFNELDDLGKQTMLSQLLWAAKLTKGSLFSKKVEERINKGLSLI